MLWDERDYDSGLDHGVFYLQDGRGEAWNGLTSVLESPSDIDEQTRHVDGVKTYFRRRSGEFSGTIQAYTYPQSFYENVLAQKRRNSFGMSYRIRSDSGYEIHLVYNALISSSEYSYNQSDEIDPFSWNFTAKPEPIPGAKPSAHLIVNTSKAYLWTITALEDLLYGNESGDSRLPSPEEVLEIFEVNSILRVIDHGDGTFTAIGPNEVIQMLDDTTFQINWPSAVYIDEVTYTLSSL